MNMDPDAMDFNTSMMMVTGNFSRPTSGNNRSQIFFIVTTVVIGIGMIGIGATVHYKILLDCLKKPKAYVLGVLLQLLAMPLLAWALTRIFNMAFGEALGVFIQGCSPGGTTSNLVVYWMGGIVDLSVAMTITTTLLSLGTIPLWLLICDTAEPNSQDVLVPYDQLGIALVALVIPIAIGMVIKVRFEKHANTISKVIITLASIVVLILLILRGILSTIPWVATWKQVLVAALLPLIAFALGYLVTLIPFLKLSSRIRTTVSVEIALQNVQVASAVIQLTAGSNEFLFIQMVLFPILYYVFQLGYAVLFIIFYNLAKRKRWISDDKEVQEKDFLKSSDKEANGMNLKENEVKKSTSNEGNDNIAFEAS